MDLMSNFINENKDKVWKLHLFRENGFAKDEGHYYTGVCIERSGIILTHAFKVKFKKMTISLINSANETYVGKIVRHKSKQGLALLTMKEKGERSFPYVEFGEESKIVVGQRLYAVTYPMLSIKPFLLSGYVAYAPYRKVGDQLGLTDITRLDTTVRLLQVNDLGASDELIDEEDCQISRSCYGLNEARGCPLFDNVGGLVGIILFQMKNIDFAAHVSDISKFVKGYVDSSGPSCGKGKE